MKRLEKTTKILLGILVFCFLLVFFESYRIDNKVDDFFARKQKRKEEYEDQLGKQNRELKKKELAAIQKQNLEQAIIGYTWSRYSLLQNGGKKLVKPYVLINEQCIGARLLRSTWSWDNRVGYKLGIVIGSSTAKNVKPLELAKLAHLEDGAPVSIVTVEPDKKGKPVIVHIEASNLCKIPGPTDEMVNVGFIKEPTAKQTVFIFTEDGKFIGSPNYGIKDTSEIPQSDESICFSVPIVYECLINW